jgi:hypothetical protein
MHYTTSQLELITKGLPMATRSTIAKLNPDNTVTAIYCHWDGYISNNGRILKDHYMDPDKIDQLIDLGALSSLRPEIGKAQSFDNPTSQDWCLAYGRDRGEDHAGADTYASVQVWLDNGGQEYNYLWDGAEWQVSCSITNRKLRSLVQVILEGD